MMRNSRTSQGAIGLTLQRTCMGLTVSLFVLVPPVFAQKSEQEHFEQAIVYNDQGLPVCPVDFDPTYDTKEPETEPQKKQVYRQTGFRVDSRFPFAHLYVRVKEQENRKLRVIPGCPKF